MKERAASWRTAAERVCAALYDEKKRVNLLLCAGLAGLLLLAFSEWLPDSTSQEQPAAAVPTPQNQQDYAEQLEDRLQELISHVDGVGRTQVMVTLAQGEESVYATDRETSQDGSSRISHVLTGDEGLVRTIQTPQVLGVAVICEGGESPAVQNRVCALVESLTGVGANHITVAKMAPSE